MNSLRQEIANATVYASCNGELRTGVSIDHRKLAQSGARIVADGAHLDVDIDLDAHDGDIYKSKGHILPPDEVLHMNNSTNVKIPIKHRDEFPAGQGLPSSEFLTALHYYASHKYSGNAGLIQSMDETALLAFGLLAELWVNEAIGESSATVFGEMSDEENGKDDDGEIEEEDSDGEHEDQES